MFNYNGFLFSCLFFFSSQDFRLLRPICVAMSRFVFLNLVCFVKEQYFGLHLLLKALALLLEIAVCYGDEVSIFWHCLWLCTVGVSSYVFGTTKIVTFCFVCVQSKAVGGFTLRSALDVQ